MQAFRQRQPRAGVKKLYRYLGQELALLPIRYGRDRFYQVLRRHGLLAAKRRRKQITTHPGRCVFANLVGREPAIGPNTVVHADITYLNLRQGFAYLSLVQDRFSRKILGYALTENLSAVGPLTALKQAVCVIGKGKCQGLIHHSDQGVQYGCWQYVNYLQDRGIQSSMSAKGNPYDNAYAERVIGILKQELGLNSTFENLQQAQNVTKKAIKIYNDERIHMSINYMTPNQLYQRGA